MSLKANARTAQTTLGTGNTVGTNNSPVALGTGNAATGSGSVAIGQNNVATGTESVVLGASATDRGRFAGVFHASGAASVPGDHLTSIDIMLRGRTTDATPTRLTANAGVAGGTNTVNMADSSAITFTANIIANNVGTAAKAWQINGLIRRGVGAGTAVLVGSTVTVLFADAALSTATITLAADTTLGCLSVTATGVAATNIGWTVSMMTSEAA